VNVATDPTGLRDWTATALRAVAVPSDDATLVADSLVQADLWGHQSHGVMRLPWYVNRIVAGVMNPVTEPELVVDRGAVVVLDGHDGIGQVLAGTAMEIATDRAIAHGLGAVAVRNSNHFGTAAYFTRRPATRGHVAILTTNASPAMAPWGGKIKTVGTNPWSIAAPAGTRGVTVMDIANTAVARGKIYLAQQRGESTIPEGWALDADGKPTTDPAAAISGLIMPMAGHKGYVISLMMDVLSGVLTGSSFSTEVAGPYQYDRRGGAGHLAIVLNVDWFMPLAEFEKRMDQLLDELKNVPLADGHDEIVFPGELEDRNERSALEEGLRLPAQTVNDLDELADSVGVERLARAAT
jgi:LDH2 family malate/lactate/ureidoglycolate dehydrogenase